MALGVVTLRPNSTSQLGSWTVTGAATADAALSDNSDSSYVQVIPRCRLDPAVLRIGFPTPTIPAGAKVFSVGLRRRVATFVTTPGTPAPQCLHWFRSIFGVISVAGQVAAPQKYFFHSDCPTTTVTSAFVDETLGVFTTGPGGVAWDVATNLVGLTYDLDRGDDLAGNLKVGEVFVDVTYQQVSTVTVTAPTGTVATTRPTITWTYASPDSQPQQAYEVAIYTAFQVGGVGFVPFVNPPIQQSGLVLGEDQQWTLTNDLPDGGYSAFVRATSAWGGPGTFRTAIASTSWTRAVAAGGGSQPPGAQPPNATLTSATFDSVDNRVALVMVPSSSSPVTVAFTVQASRDSGVTWLPIPSLTLIPANGMTPVTAYDYVAPINVTSSYRVMAYSSSPLVGAADFSNVVSVMTTGSSWWLKCPANPLLNTVLPVAAPSSSGGTDSGLKITLRRMQGTFELLSGSGSTVLPIIVSGPTYGEQGELELIFIPAGAGQLPQYYAAYLALDQSGDVLLLQKPNGEQIFVVLGPGALGQDTEGHYDAVPGSPSTVQWRRIKVTYSQVGPPTYY